MKKMLSFTLILVMLLCFCSCAGAAKLPEYADLDKLPGGYGTENAIADGCVVIVDSKLVSGDGIWTAFLTNAEKNVPCKVRVARKSGEKDSFWFIDLSYADSVFTVQTNDGISKSYKYLNHYGHDAGADPAIERYILTNVRDITYSEIERRMASSLLADSIDVFTVYYVMK